MKAALCKSLDGPDGIVIENLAEPKAGPGEVVLRVRAAALNFFDTLITRGKYQTRPELPFSPAGEIAGVVESVGPGVVGLSRGQRVAAYVGYGGAREKVAVAAQACVPIPDTLSDEAAASIAITYGTAIHGLKDRAQLKAGEWVAVSGASGGAGLAAIEIAKNMGGRVIAIASGAEKIAVCKEHGAEVTIDYRSEDLKEALRRETSGEGIDVAYDCVGGSTAEPMLRALRWQGRYLVIGFASGDIPKIPLNLLLVKGSAAIGVFWGEFVKRNPEQHRQNMVQILKWISTGRLHPVIHKTYPLSDTAAAIRLLDRREAVGKVILTMD
jgi:NADPH2:quinone reductase